MLTIAYCWMIGKISEKASKLENFGMLLFIAMFFDTVILVTAFVQFGGK